MYDFEKKVKYIIKFTIVRPRVRSLFLYNYYQIVNTFFFSYTQSSDRQIKHMVKLSKEVQKINNWLPFIIYETLRMKTNFIKAKYYFHKLFLSVKCPWKVMGYMERDINSMTNIYGQTNINIKVKFFFFSIRSLLPHQPKI